MTFHKEGSTSIALCILLIFVLNALIQFYHPQAHALKWIVYILSFVFFVFVTFFFRKPSVEVIADDKVALSPADGKVVAIEEVEEAEYLKTKAIRISVHLSALNARVNRNPVAGTVKYSKYHAKSSPEKEHTTIAIESNSGKTILLRQISDSFLSGLVNNAKEGDKAEQGQQFGYVKFGNRVDVFLPLGTDVKVAVGDTVKGGETVVGQFKS